MKAVSYLLAKKNEVDSAKSNKIKSLGGRNIYEYHEAIVSVRKY